MSLTSSQSRLLKNVSLPQPLPPIFMTAFVRPDLLEPVLDGILKQTVMPEKIIAAVDGARRESDLPGIKGCLELLQTKCGDIEVEIIERPENLGCDRSIVQGISQVLETHDALIYLGDDNLPNPYFYETICRLLSAYRDEPRIASISAYAGLPAALEIPENCDFLTSRRLFDWGFATWGHKWREINLGSGGEALNPFGTFYKMPATLQTKMTMHNQFWLEKNKGTDWVITFTVVSLFLDKVHLISTKSLIENIGFGHPESYHYKGAEPDWVNSRFDADYCPQYLPQTLALPDLFEKKLSHLELLQTLQGKSKVWLSPDAFLYLLGKVRSLTELLLLVQIFVSRLPILLRRLKAGLPI